MHYGNIRKLSKIQWVALKPNVRTVRDIKDTMNISGSTSDSYKLLRYWLLETKTDFLTVLEQGNAPLVV